MKIDTGSKGEELYNVLSEIMARYSDGDRLYALGLFGVHTRRWLQRERNLNPQQANMLINIALDAAEDQWRKLEQKRQI